MRAGGAQEIREVRAGEAHEAALEDLPGPIDSRAGGARKILGVDETREENAGAGRVEVLTVDPSIELAVHEAVGEVVAGGSSIRRRTSCPIVCRTGCT